jgi:hypothetical protein
MTLRSGTVLHQGHATRPVLLFLSKERLANSAIENQSGTQSMTPLEEYGDGFLLDNVRIELGGGEAPVVQEQGQEQDRMAIIYTKTSVHMGCTLSYTAQATTEARVTFYMLNLPWKKQQRTMRGAITLR